ncbi:MAG: hypothetical protein WC548_03855 [Candidatus Pacearchaeota archaeon]
MDKETKKKLETGKGYIKKIAFVGLLLLYSYTLLSTLNILPRYSTMYGKRPGTLISFAIDPLKNFGAWLIISAITFIIVVAIYYYFSSKKKSAENFKSRFIYDLVSYILFYGLIFFLANIIIITLIKIFGII